MTIVIQRGQTNNFCITALNDNAIYYENNKTYKFVFTNDISKTAQDVSIIPVVKGNRYNFTIIEGTTIDFAKLGFYTYKIFEVENITLNENLLHSGKMKITETRTSPPKTNLNMTYKAYGN